MSDTALAWLITVLGLLALATWVPLLHAAQTLIVRLTERETTPQAQEEELTAANKAA